MPSTPAGFWVGFHALLLVLLGAELAYSRRRSNRPPRRTAATARRTALVSTIFWVGAALLFSVAILLPMPRVPATEYLAGYAIEESLSIDNLFLFLLLFRMFRIEPVNQPRILFWGVLGAIVMRGAFIAAGVELLGRFHWISYAFGAILLIGAIRLLFPEDETETTGAPRWLRWLTRLHPVSSRQDLFFVREDGHGMPTVLMLALIAIELTDVVFALDSIPAVLSITRHPFIAYTSNIMAVMGLRSMFFLLSDLLTRLRFLHFGLAAVLAFAALKMLTAKWVEVGPVLSLSVIVVVLALTIGTSLVAPGMKARDATKESTDG